MADIDTGKDSVSAMVTWLKDDGRLFPQRAADSCAVLLEALAADRDRLSRELAEAREALLIERGLVTIYRSDVNATASRAERAEKQLAESERLAAARNQLNGELAMENERLREALRKYGRHAFACSTNREYTGWLNHQPEHCSCGLDAALTAPAKVVQPAPAFTHDAEGRN